jgi:hypothetical protein
MNCVCGYHGDQRVTADACHISRRSVQSCFILNRKQTIHRDTELMLAREPTIQSTSNSIIIPEQSINHTVRRAFTLNFLSHLHLIGQ